MSNYKITVVIVTYGKRKNFLCESLNSVKDNFLVSDIIVVDNGSYEDIETLCKPLYNSKIKFVKTGKNLGSAGGFYAGIKFAYEQGKGDFIFLLDDDNVVEVNCLENLIEHYIELGGDKNVCLKAFKYNKKGEVLYFKYNDTFDLKNSFFHFHLKSKILYYIYKLLKKNKRDYALLPVKGVAYSGFFFNKYLVMKNGLPEKEMILYCDDTEYSLRFIKNGAKIFLCSNCKLKDLDVSWHHKKYNGNPFLSSGTNRIRSYYSIRNRVYVEKKYLVNSKIVYTLNFIIWISYNLAKTLILDKNTKDVIKNFSFFLNAFKDGWNGKLGIKYYLEDL